MKRQILSARDLGLIIRAVRKSSGVRQDDLAGIVGVSKQFATDVERGKPTVQMDRAFLLLKELGLSLTIDVPESAREMLLKLELQREGDPESDSTEAPSAKAQRSQSKTGSTNR